jgi:ubiquinone/menaquinone biosynthesis C-methylase UbiE
MSSDQLAMDETSHLHAVSRVYGPETRAVYDRLDRSLDPRGPEAMLTLASERITKTSRVLDVGCRDASHLIELARITGASGVGLDPVPRLIEQAGKAVSESGLDDRIELIEGVMQHIPCRDASFDLVWCRDVIEVVEDLDGGVAEMARVLRPGGYLIVFTVLATNRLEPKEAEMLLGQNLAIVADNLVERNVEAAFRRAGLALVVRDEIGTEWREYAEERSQVVSRALLRLARLRRQRDSIVERSGKDIYAHIESNLHWEVFQFLGKLLPTIYVLSKRTLSD